MVSADLVCTRGSWSSWFRLLLVGTSRNVIHLLLALGQNLVRELQILVMIVCEGLVRFLDSCDTPLSSMMLRSSC